MNKKRRYRERVLKGNTKLLKNRALEHGMGKDDFISKIATSEISFLDKSTVTLLELMGMTIPKHLKIEMPLKIVKKTTSNTEIIDFGMTKDEYDGLFKTAIQHSFTNRGNIGQLLDKLAVVEVIFKIFVDNGKLNKKEVENGTRRK